MGRSRLFSLLISSLCWALLTAGCLTASRDIPSSKRRTAHAAEIARTAGFVRSELYPVSDRKNGFEVATASGDPVGDRRISPLPVVGWTRLGAGSKCVHVYLEGDGHAWVSRGRYSDDPTPIDPIGLRLATQDTSGATIIYLGRPCQYRDASGESDAAACRPIFWTNARYGDAVLEALDEHLDSIIFARQPEELRLIGFSGGGVLAALLAARRAEVDAFVTVAAPLDLEAWAAETGVTPLVLSHNPLDQVDWLRTTPQDHFVGGADDVVPEEVTRRFIRALGADAPARVHSVPGMSHSGWAEDWAPRIARVADSCAD